MERFSDQRTEAEDAVSFIARWLEDRKDSPAEEDRDLVIAAEMVLKDA